MWYVFYPELRNETGNTASKDKRVSHRNMKSRHLVIRYLSCHVDGATQIKFISGNNSFSGEKKFPNLNTSSVNRQRVLSLEPTRSPLLSFVVLQSISCVRLFSTPWTAAHQAFLSFTICFQLKIIQMPKVTHLGESCSEPLHP